MVGEKSPYFKEAIERIEEVIRILQEYKVYIAEIASLIKKREYYAWWEFKINFTDILKFIRELKKEKRKIYLIKEIGQDSGEVITYFFVKKIESKDKEKERILREINERIYRILALMFKIGLELWIWNERIETVITILAWLTACSREVISQIFEELQNIWVFEREYKDIIKILESYLKH